MVVTKKTATRIKNYTSGVSVDASLQIIRRLLAAHKARRIIFEGDDDGNTTGLLFELTLNQQPFTFRLPVRVAHVRRLVQQANSDSHLKRLDGDELDEQAQRTAWSNVRAWVEAQMALIDGSGAKVEEVFFPYLVDGTGRTMFEMFEERLALPAPRGGAQRTRSTRNGDERALCHLKDGCIPKIGERRPPQ